ncbi:redox-regulated ATPase YchF [Candidatus Kaiserbacteria bacterium]|nr:redox-regulated ATPase YchF [Candidatus Kaiserbacteria bacterium]
MKLSVGIVGLPNVGKSTLFNALTKNSVPAENYPFCTIDPSVGIVAVPDNRLDTLTKISKSQKTIPAAIEFVDIAGLVKGAADGEGLGNQFLSHIRETDMIAEVVRIFDDEDTIHIAGVVNPLADIEVINLELVLTDLQTVAKRLTAAQNDLKRGDKTATKAAPVLARLREHLKAGQLARTLPVADAEETAPIRELQLLTTKPILYVLNKKAGAFNIDEQNDPRWTALTQFMEETGSEYVLVDAGVEHELKDLAEDEKQEFRREYGTQDSGIADLIRACYRLLGLISYFTTGQDETRAWTIPNGSTAPEAGTAIHTDFRDKFIRASVVAYEDLVNAGSIAAARERGTLRTEGKEYVVKDGDVIEFRI